MGGEDSAGMAMVRIIAVEACVPGGGVFVEVAGRELAVFRLTGSAPSRPTDARGVGHASPAVLRPSDRNLPSPTDGERFVVMDNRCPHAGGNLSGGTVADGVVTCPWHDWDFDLKTGVCTHSRLACVPVYPVQVRDGFVHADLARPVVGGGDQA